MVSGHGFTPRYAAKAGTRGKVPFQSTFHWTPSVVCISNAYENKVNSLCTSSKAFQTELQNY